MEEIEVRFDQEVTINASDLTVRNLTDDGTLVDLSGAQFDYVAAMNIAIWDLNSLASPLPAGFYEIEISSNAVTSVASGLNLLSNLNEQVYVALPGDANLDGKVDVLRDGAALIENLGGTQNLTWSQGDFNGDGATNVLIDGSLLIEHLGASVVPDGSGMGSDSPASGVLATPVGLPLSGQSQMLDDEEKRNQIDTYAQQDRLIAEEDFLILS
jgi:hypothetical protein